MSQVYPTTLFKDGTDLTDYVVVADPGEQAHAATQGYFPHGQASKPPADDTPKAKPRKARA